MAEDPADPRASEPIGDLRWDEVQSLQLKDGSTPVLLSTVLEDIANSGTKLVVELKSCSPAAPLAEFLSRRPDLAASVGFVLSFALAALETFTVALSAVTETVTGTGKPAVVWLLDNPSSPYSDGDLNEGETTFDYTSEALAAFLARTGLCDRVRRLQCGLYLQYNPKLAPEQINAVRLELDTLCGGESGASAEGRRSFLGIWSDACLDPNFDSAAIVSSLLPILDAVNSDLPDGFWS